MIISFYNKDFRGLQNNASLVIDDSSYSLIRRPVEMNDLSCVCEAFTEDIQPTFLVVKNNAGNYVYGCLAGIPQLNEENKTEITGTDLKSLLSSDIILNWNTINASGFTKVSQIVVGLFALWNTYVNQNSLDYVLDISEIDDVELGDYVPDTTADVGVANCWDTLQPYLKVYNLYLDTSIDLIEKKIVFKFGKTMQRNINIRLWEYGIRNYGKWVADTNECQGYYQDEETGSLVASDNSWILTSQNQITVDKTKRDIYPIKKRIVISNESKQDADLQALTELTNSMFNENIDITTQNINPSFETNFSVYVARGKEKYKDLPCGELRYNSSGLYECQIGYRFTGLDFV